MGKTTLSLALGLGLARRDARVLVITSHPLAELALSISLDGLDERDPTAAANLFVAHIDPKQALARTVREQVPSRLLARRIVASRIYRALIEIAPGLKELAFLSRLRDVSSRDDGSSSFDHVVWDAPATGHFLEILRVSGKFESLLTGPFQARGRELARYFAAADLRIHPVTTLEEMAIEETLELHQGLSGELGLPPASLICNMVSPLLRAPETEVDELDRSRAPADLALVLEAHRTERKQFERLRSSAGTSCLLVQRIRHDCSDLDLLFGLSDQLTETLHPSPCKS